MDNFIYGMLAVLIPLWFISLRLTTWHSKESSYWNDVGLEVMFNPNRNAYYTPILEHAQTHPLSVWQRVLGWESPEKRMAKQEKHG